MKDEWGKTEPSRTLRARVTGGKNTGGNNGMMHEVQTCRSSFRVVAE